MAQETTEKRRSNARTPRATQPVFWRMLPRSIKKNVVNRKMTSSPQFWQNFFDFRTVAHATRGINEVWRNNVALLAKRKYMECSGSFWRRTQSTDFLGDFYSTAPSSRDLVRTTAALHL